MRSSPRPAPRRASSARVSAPSRAVDKRTIDVEISIAAAPSVLFDAVVLPDGDAAARALAGNGLAREFVQDQFRHCKPILALGASQALLDAAGIPNGAPGVVGVQAPEADAAVTHFTTPLARHRVYERETDPPAV